MPVSKGQQKFNSKSMCVISAIGFAVLFVLIIISPGNINPENTEWVIHGGGDNYQHYIGWRFFRNSPWSKHFLYMQDLNYPVGTTVIVMDSNPLFSVCFKVLRNILPENFQFNGIWLLCSYILIAVFMAIIARQLSGNYWVTLACVLLAICNPVVLQRALIHDTLTAHWLILAAIWLLLNRRKKWNCAGWFILFFLTLSIHFYFLPMVAYILCLQMVSMLAERSSVKSIILIMFCSVSALCLGYFGLGYCYILPESGSYGELTLNLNAFINPDGTSSLLKNRQTLPLQYEGYNYLGLGMIVLLGISIIAAAFRRNKRFLLYAIPTIALIFIAASNHGYFDLIPVYNIGLPEVVYRFLSIFRSSGRLVWPFYYLILVFALKTILSDSHLRKWCSGIFCLCLVLQAADLSGFMKNCAERFRNPENRLAELPEAVLAEIPEGTQHLFIESSDSKVQDAWALFAAEHAMTYNKSSNSRDIMPIYCSDPVILSELCCEQLEADAVYIYDETASVPENIYDCDGIAVQEADSYSIFHWRPE